MKFNTKAPVFYVGRGLQIGLDDDVKVLFYRRGADGVFRLPNNEDKFFVHVDDLHVMLPEPITLTGSKTREQ